MEERADTWSSKPPQLPDTLWTLHCYVLLSRPYRVLELGDFYCWSEYNPCGISWSLITYSITPIYSLPLFSSFSSGRDPVRKRGHRGQTVGIHCNKYAATVSPPSPTQLDIHNNTGQGSCESVPLGTVGLVFKFCAAIEFQVNTKKTV